MNKVRILFLVDVDRGNTNAQSLNVREIALRLDPDRFHCTLFYEQEPDSRLRNHPGIQLLKLPPHGKTWRILSEMLSGYSIIAYVHSSPANYLFLHLPRFLRSRTKTVFHAEGPAAQMVNPSRSLRFLHNGTHPRCDVYTGISDFIARDIHRNLNKKVSFLLPVGVDTTYFTPPAKRSNALPVVLFAGTLIERKGPQHLIDCAVRFPNAAFRIVGAGRHGFADVLRQRIESLGLTNITLDGPKTQEEVLEIMRASDIFLLPSRLEGIPKVTLEAAATGLPCIVFRDYETPSVVHGETGFQVTTLEEMMAALDKLISDPSLRERMGRAAREHVKKFEWNFVSQLWQSAYLEIASKPID